MPSPRAVSEVTGQQGGRDEERLVSGDDDLPRLALASYNVEMPRARA